MGTERVAVIAVRSTNAISDPRTSKVRQHSSQENNQSINSSQMGLFRRTRAAFYRLESDFFKRSEKSLLFMYYGTVTELLLKQFVDDGMKSQVRTSKKKQHEKDDEGERKEREQRLTTCATVGTTTILLLLGVPLSK